MTHTASWRITPRPEAVSDVRGDVRKALADWGAETAIDDNTLIVSELVTNALRHGAPDITLSLAANTSQVIGAVTDQGHGQPRIQSVTELHIRGRGLHLVQDLASTWGVTPSPSNGRGKTVWWTWQC